MVKFIIGEYKIKKDDLVPNYWNHNLVKRKKLQSHKNVVLYAESLGLKKHDIEFIMKKSTENVTVVCETKKALCGVRKSPKVKLQYSEGYCEPASPFDMAKMILTMSDRNYVYGFLNHNKAQMFMIVKVLVSNYMYCKKDSNKLAIGWLDQNLYRVKPEFLWAYAAFKIKPEPQIKFMRWHWPKKKKEK